MRKAAELVVLGKRSFCPDRLKASGGRLFQPGQRILGEDIPQQGYTLFPQLRCWILGRHIVSFAETARLWRRLARRPFPYGSPAWRLAMTARFNPAGPADATSARHRHLGHLLRISSEKRDCGLHLRNKTKIGASAGDTEPEARRNIEEAIHLTG